VADDDAAFLTALTTEHFGLAGARSATVSEAAGRSSLYLASVSSGLIALGFVAQVADETFRLFALAVIPVLAWLGLITFMRVLENGIEDILYARAIGRIRQYYLELAGPERARFFLLAPGDSYEVVLRNMAVEPGRWQLFFTSHAMIAVVNSAVVGAGLALVAGALGASDGVAIGVAVVAMIAGFALHERYARRRYERTEARDEILFPGGAPARG
jgi:hypothetical protein